MIESFNINTNAWVLHYVYKRLRFLNNRNPIQYTSKCREYFLQKFWVLLIFDTNNVNINENYNYVNI